MFEPEIDAALARVVEVDPIQGNDIGAVWRHAKELHCAYAEAVTRAGEQYRAGLAAGTISNEKVEEQMDGGLRAGMFAGTDSADGRDIEDDMLDGGAPLSPPHLPLYEQWTELIARTVDRFSRRPRRHYAEDERRQAPPAGEVWRRVLRLEKSISSMGKYVLDCSRRLKEVELRQTDISEAVVTLGRQLAEIVERLGEKPGATEIRYLSSGHVQSCESRLDEIEKCLEHCGWETGSPDPRFMNSDDRIRIDKTIANLSRGLQTIQETVRAHYRELC